MSKINDVARNETHILLTILLFSSCLVKTATAMCADELVSELDRKFNAVAAIKDDNLVALTTLLEEKTGFFLRGPSGTMIPLMMIDYIQKREQFGLPPTTYSSFLSLLVTNENIMGIVYLLGRLEQKQQTELLENRRASCESDCFDHDVTSQYQLIKDCALLAAARKSGDSTLAIMQLLIAHGADPKAWSPPANLTILDGAVLSCSKAKVHYLIEACHVPVTQHAHILAASSHDLDDIAHILARADNFERVD